VAILPVAGILFIGALLLGAGTLRDISLALFIGILVGTYSTIFIAAPLYAQLRGYDESVKKQDKRVLSARQASLVE
jgi:preprotein translocase subunit SecF